MRVKLRYEKEKNAVRFWVLFIDYGGDRALAGHEGETGLTFRREAHGAGFTWTDAYSFRYPKQLHDLAVVVSRLNGRKNVCPTTAESGVLV